MEIRKRIITEKTTIAKLFNRIGVKDEELARVDLPYPIYVNTPYGYKKIASAFRTEKQSTVTTYFRNNSTLKTSPHHQIRVGDEWKKIQDVTDNDVVQTETGTTSILRKHIGREEILYDISVEDVHCYYSNGIVSHNSWILTKIGCEAMKRMKNVAHFTLELNENYVGLRYDCCFTHFDFQDIRNHVDEVKEKVKHIPGRLKVKYFPLKSVSAQSLKYHIERIQMIDGIKIDLAVVDYADILRPMEKDKNANSYSEMGGIYEELRTVAGELQIPIWTASQTNREGSNQDIVEAHNISDSYRKIMTADFILSMSRKVNDKTNNTARFHVIKNRFGPDGITLYSKMNASNGDIRIFDEKARESAEIKATMQDEENDTKALLRSRWNKKRSDDMGKSLDS